MDGLASHHIITFNLAIGELLRISTPYYYSGFLLRISTPYFYSGFLLRISTPDFLLRISTPDFLLRISTPAPDPALRVLLHPVLCPQKPTIFVFFARIPKRS